MRIRCVHGYYFIHETRKADISDFMQIFGLEIVPKDDYFTFALLKYAENYSFIGRTYLGLSANKTFEGNPWDVMRKNGFVYNFNTGFLVPISTVQTPLKVNFTGSYYFSDGLIMPGSIEKDGAKVTDYSCFVDFSTTKFIYTEITHAETV